MKKTFSIITVITFIIFVIYLLASIFKPAAQPKSTYPIPTKSEEPITIPKISADKLLISGIKTSNFLANPIRSSIDGAVLFLKTNNAEAVYYKKYNQFNLIISSSSAQIRNQAEQEFIKKLGITKEDACRLNVIVNSPYVPNPYLTLPRKTLSFCVDY